MGNPILQQIQSYRIIGNICELNYVFEPGPLLVDVFKSFPAGTMFHLFEGPDRVQINPLPGQSVPGVRVKVGEYFIYLDISPDTCESREKMDQAKIAHYKMMTYKCYYAREKDLLEYWQVPDDHFNQAEQYAKTEAEERSRFLVNLIRKHCGPIESALEIGCNVGRNLHVIKEELSIDVAGIEISSHALSLLPEVYPDLRGCRFLQGQAQERIKDLADHSYDLVFTMAVFMHLHPTTPNSFWGEIARVARKHILIIENEHGATERNWARNYKGLFEEHGKGVKQIYETRYSKGQGDLADLDNYTLRVFNMSDA